MMPSPYNPTRRNRNIGTPKQGHGTNNRMVVPKLSGFQRDCTVQIGAHIKLEREVNGRKTTFIVEEPHGGCAHACTVEDLEFLLSHIPVADWAGLDTFVLRQPTRKSRMLNPVWGRLYYHADLAFLGSRARWSGPAVFLEACKVDDIIKWSTSLDRETTDELDRLRADGHRVDRTARTHIISTDINSVRATQLYRTLLHEIGHWFDWLEKVESPAVRGEDYGELIDAYFARPKNEREAFAHRYADHWREILHDSGVIPFGRIGGQLVGEDACSDIRA
ncbi:hypothetical protein [Sphingobium lactosutens]|uniref:hypothetical protein n=1 Tax=Sphingobium lactosutens TaxID=522773 RepID=UPI0015B9C395|nr:hypothetical protein [Sphingobium lactosutens]